MTAATRTSAAPRSTGRCPICRSPIKTRHKVTRVAGRGWCHSSCAAAARRTASPS